MSESLNKSCLPLIFKAYTNSTDTDKAASDEAVWSGSPLFDILVSITDSQYFIENRESKLFKVLEHIM